MKKILFLTHEFPPCKAGAGTFSFGIANGLSKKRENHVIVLAPSYSKKDSSFDKRQIFNIVRLPLTKLTLINYLIGLIGFLYRLVRFKPEFVFITDIMSQRTASIISFFIHKKYFILAHGSEVLANFSESIIKRNLFTRIYTKSQKIIANSNYTKNLLEKFNVASDKIVVINPGVDLNMFTTVNRPERIITKHNLMSHKIILSVGNLSERKGHDTLIRALPQIIEKINTVNYVIVGNGENLNKLKKLAKSYKVKRNVIFAGRIPDSELIDYYDACDIFVMPNRKVGNLVEGFGIVFMEAAARGKPVIAGKSGGASDAVVDGQTGYLVDPLDNKKLAETIIMLLENEELTTQMGNLGKQRCLNYFNWDYITDRISGIMK